MGAHRACTLQLALKFAFHLGGRGKKCVEAALPLGFARGPELVEGRRQAALRTFDLWRGKPCRARPA
jgi:hypothetical protein